MTYPVFKKYDDGRIRFDCPGCGWSHIIPTEGEHGWNWNGDLYQPTVTPSILTLGYEMKPECHSFVTDGKIQFLTDSVHYLAGQTVPLPPVGIPIKSRIGDITDDESD